MKIRLLTAAALALAAGCGGAGAGAGPPHGGGPSPGAPAMAQGRVGGGAPDIFALIGARAQLGLTGQQVTELDSIHRSWSVRNDSLRRQVRDAAGAHGRMDLEVARPLLERLAENNHAAGRAVESVLDEEQRRLACTLRAPERRWTPARPPGLGVPGRGGMRPADRVAADTLAALRVRGWAWCTPGTAADSAAAAATRAP